MVADVGAREGRLRSDPLPNWPLLMPTSLAARYLSLDENNFLHVASAGDVRPVELGLELTRWRRSDLDRLVGKLAMGPLSKPLSSSPDTSKFEQAILDRISQALALRAPATASGPQSIAVTIKQAAELIGLSRGSIYRLVSEGQLKSFKVGGRVLIKREDLVILLSPPGDGVEKRGRGRPRKAP